jgi:hypothetical protein
MTETTHEALVRQTSAAEELLGYFQGQRAAFQADVAQAQADYVALSSDLVGIVEGKLDQRIYIDSANGDNTANGSSSAPVASIQEAYGRLVPGCTAEIRLRRGDTYQVGRDALQCSLDNAYVTHQVWGDTADPKPLIQHTLTDLNGAAYSNGFAGKGLNLFFLSCGFEVALNQNALAVTRFNGLFTGVHNSSVTLETCDIALGDMSLVKSAYGEPVHVGLRGCAITRQAGATGHLIDANSGILRISSSTPPSGETWADMISGQVYAADGECRNFITNVTL